MKNLLKIIVLLIILFTWMFPVIISFYTFNFWYILLYTVWWIPAYIVTGIASIIADSY